MLKKITDILTDNLLKKEINAVVNARLKDPYSILKKLERKNIPLEQLTDLVAFRVIVVNKPTCYRALDVMHSIHNVSINEVKDYILSPKDNGYQSIHIKIISRYFPCKIEVQIRSNKMHKEAELGRAAHINYKQMQENNVQRFFNLENSFLSRALEIHHSFQWDISELQAYTHEINNVWQNIYQSKNFNIIG